MRIGDWALYAQKARHEKRQTEKEIKKIKRLLGTKLETSESAIQEMVQPLADGILNGVMSLREELEALKADGEARQLLMQLALLIKLQEQQEFEDELLVVALTQ